MKITLEPTTKDNQFDRPTIIYMSQFDDANLDDIYTAIKALLIAWGFSEDTIDEYFGMKEEEDGLSV